MKYDISDFFIPCICFTENFIDYGDNQLTAVIQDCPECSVIYICHILFPSFLCIDLAVLVVAFIVSIIQVFFF